MIEFAYTCGLEVTTSNRNPAEQSACKPCETPEYTLLSNRPNLE